MVIALLIVVTSWCKSLEPGDHCVVIIIILALTLLTFYYQTYGKIRPFRTLSYIFIAQLDFAVSNMFVRENTYSIVGKAR